jgi:hypothetical protein
MDRFKSSMLQFGMFRNNKCWSLAWQLCVQLPYIVFPLYVTILVFHLAYNEGNTQIKSQLKSWTTEFVDACM